MGFDIQERLTAFAMLGATWIMWLLVLLSVIGVAIILERAWFFLSTRDDLRQLRQDLADLLAKGDLAGAARRMAGSKSFEARVVQSGLDMADKGPAAVEERMAGESRLARLAMERNLAFLGTVGNNAPFVGLLGTVIGMINTFTAITLFGTGNPQYMAHGIQQALVTTVEGLVTAIPLVFLHGAIQGKSRELVQILEEQTAGILAAQAEKANQ